MAAVKKKRVAVFIDGSNFYFKLKTLIPQKMDFLHYRYRDLFRQLLIPGEEIVYTGYYVGVVRDDGKHRKSEKAHEMRQNQQKLFDQLTHQNIAIIRGYLMERDGKFFEKGVDVRLAVDIVTMAFEKKYDIAFVVSSDTDLIPAIQKAQAYKREIVHVGFEHQPSLALIRYASRSRMIIRREAEKCAAKPIKIRRFDED
jgi:uncharacterized LabA/DUF88 family protein